jgi:serine protease Do
MRNRRWIAALFVITLSSFPALGQKKVDALQHSLGDSEVKGPWIYNDLKAGFAEATRTGKPLLVVFRCVP